MTKMDQDDSDAAHLFASNLFFFRGASDRVAFKKQSPRQEAKSPLRQTKKKNEEEEQHESKGDRERKREEQIQEN